MLYLTSLAVWNSHVISGICRNKVWIDFELIFIVSFWLCGRIVQARNLKCLSFKHVAYSPGIQHDRCKFLPVDDVRTNNLCSRSSVQIIHAPDPAGRTLVRGYLYRSYMQQFANRMKVRLRRQLRGQLLRQVDQIRVSETAERPVG